MFNLKKNPTDKILELGGGGNPVVTPQCQGGSDINCDVRYCTNTKGERTVDFTADFDEPLPIQTDEFDGVLSVFCLEHVSWRKLPQFINEIYRVLKPGCKATLVTPNTEAQLKWIQDHPDGWDKNGAFGDASCLLFGDLDYKENSHKSFFSPKLAEKLFNDAGFIDFKWAPYGINQTDMAVEAYKPQKKTLEQLRIEAETETPEELIYPFPTKDNPVEQKIQQAEEQMAISNIGGSIVVAPPSLTAQAPKLPNHAGLTTEERAELFGRDYFDGGRKYGGYASPGYRDFPANQNVFQHVMVRKPQSILELGCGRGYLLKKFQDAGVEAEGIEISKHCQMSRVCEKIELEDYLADDVARFGFDLCVSQDFWQYVPEEKIGFAIDKMARSCKRGLHGINFGDTYDGFDRLVCSLHNRDWWMERMPKGHEVRSSDELASGTLSPSYLQGDGKVKLSIGGFSTMFHYGWVNIDVADLAGFAQPNGYSFVRYDVRNGLPFLTQTVDLIFLPHFLQRLTYDEGLRFLRECRRVLKTDGAMRILVPDAEKIMSSDSSWFEELKQISPSIEVAPTLKRKQWEMVGNGQQSAYDAETIETQLYDAGFVSALTLFRKTIVHPGSRQTLRETSDIGQSYALFVDTVPKV